MNGESQIELFLSVMVLAFTTALATGHIRLPSGLANSPILIMFLVIIALVSFSIFPITGLALFFLLAVLIFSRNVDTTLSKVSFPSSYPTVEVREVNNAPTMPPLSDDHSATVQTHPVTERPEVLNTGDTVYGEKSIMTKRVPVASPYHSFRDDHRSFAEFNETDSQNPVLGKIEEGFVPANYGDEQGAPVEGLYPKELERASSDPESRDYTFRPAQDMGSNNFVPVQGPNIDVKMSALKY